MKSFLDSRLECIGENSSVEQILHLGPGSTQALPSYLASSAAHVLVFEANPEHAAATSQAAQADSGETAVKVLNLGVSDRCGAATLQRLNFDQFSGWRSATGLKGLFPSLRIRDSIPVELVDVAGLFEHFSFPSDGNTVLTLFEHGEAGAILNQLIATGQLAGFSDILLTLPDLPLFEGSLDGATLRTLLETHGYRLIAQETSDPDLPQAHFKLDLSAQKISMLFTELAQKKSKIAQDRKTRQALNIARKEAQSMATFQSAQRTEAEVKVKALKTDKASLSAQNAALSTEVETLREQVGALTSNIANLQEELLRARGQRELREADLRNLQDQYRQLFETRQEQDTLLANLAQDLEQTIMLLEQLKPAKRQAARKTTAKSPSKIAEQVTTKPSKARNKS